MKHTVGFQPLYKQVYDQIVQRITEGRWKPGEALPSEFALAAELGVSQGTIRKALNSLESEKLLHRAQGKGTYVAEQTDEASIFRFFRLTRLDGTRLTPSSHLESTKLRAANKRERAALQLDARTQIYDIRRTRHVDNRTCAVENIILPRSLFPNIDELGSLKDSLYPLYQKHFGIHIAQVTEQLKATTLSADDAARFEVQEGLPILKVDRIALTIDSKPVELRTTLYDTNNYIYSIDID